MTQRPRGGEKAFKKTSIRKKKNSRRLGECPENKCRKPKGKVERRGDHFQGEYLQRIREPPLGKVPDGKPSGEGGLLIRLARSEGGGGRKPSEKSKLEKKVPRLRIT